ncbi:S-layer protein [Lysinibacillus capsici]|uniref:S-layer protein n=1 Tax=Lysinibacillus capsici TaxID=2115968 RepID=UPI003081695C|nr:S-layer protein [Lysinibacillus capsici]
MKNKALSTLMATAITATLVLPMSTANAASSQIQSNSYETHVAAAKKVIGESVTIKNITKDTVITSNGTFRIQSALKPLFDTSNKAALTNARATIVVKNGQITDVTSLILNKAGTSKKTVYFDGGDALISGDLTVNADYVKIQDVSVDGQLIITNRVKKAVTLDEVVVDETITLKPIVTKKVSWLYVNLIDMKSSNINLGRTKVNISSDQTLAKVDVVGKVESFEAMTNIEKLTIDVAKDFNLYGEGKIEQIVVKGGTKVALDSGHLVNNVQVDDSRVSVTLPVIDKKELNTLIASPPYVQVSVNGYDILNTDKWTTQADRTVFDSAVASARAIANNSNASQEQVKNAINQYKNALAVYQAAQKSGTKYGYGDKASLQSLINSVQYVTVSWDGSNVPYNSPWTNQTERNAIEAAVSSAQLIVNNYYATQTDIANAINNLNTAIRTYKNAYKYGTNGGYNVEKSYLESLITSAYNELVSISYNGDGSDVPYYSKWTSQNDWIYINNYIEQAKSIVNNYYATQLEVVSAYNNLNSALSYYNSAKRDGLLH